MRRLGADVAAVDIYAFPPGRAVWDGSAWDGADDWTVEGWQSILCAVRGLDWTDGADRAAGCLTTAAPGSWTVELYDPDRSLDPANPYAYLGRYVQPGKLLRFGWSTGLLGLGIIDSCAHEPVSGLARLRGMDAVGLLSSLRVPQPAASVDHLRELARYVLGQLGIAYLSVEPDPPAGDELIGAADPVPTDPQAAWQLIAEAARDVLNMAWVDALGVIRFRPHAEGRDPGVTLGCGGIPLLGAMTATSGDAIVNRVLAKDQAGVVVTREDMASQARYGVRELDRTGRRIPAAAAWAEAVIADRAWASLQWTPEQAWPTLDEGPAQLARLFTAPMVANVRLRGDAVDPPLSVDGRLVARGAKVTPDGWTVDAVAYMSDTEWAAVPLPEPEPPDPMPPAQTVTRVATFDQVARIVTDGITPKGAGAEAAALVGTLTGADRSRLLMGFTPGAAPELADVLALQRATLRLWTPPSLAPVGPASTWGDAAADWGSPSTLWTGPLPDATRPRIRIRRLSGPFAEGTASTPSAANAVVWPGPGSTATGEQERDVPQGGSVAIDLDVTDVVRHWVPISGGGHGQPLHGFAVWSQNDADPSYAAAISTDDAPAASRPTLTIEALIPA
jgi:hypothetical protein